MAARLGEQSDACAHRGCGSLLLALAAALDSCLLEQFAVLLLRHALATLLDD
jgi:hypothetical protein